MNRLIALLLVVVCSGCAATTMPETVALITENRRPERTDLPVDPAIEPLPEDVPTEPSENYVEPITVGQCVSSAGQPLTEEVCPSESGILVSEARANRDALYRIRYRELRRTCEADRSVWAAHRELYEAQVAADQREIARLQPTWWERHDAEIMAAIGIVIGAATTIAITFAVSEVTE